MQATKRGSSKGYPLSAIPTKPVPASKNPVGRPSKLTPEVVRKLEEAAAYDASVEETCFYAEISRDTYYRWILVIGTEGSGAFGIVKMKGGQLSGNVVANAGAPIKAGNATNHIRADAVGKTLTLYVNGQQVEQLQDGDFAAGRAGLYVQSGAKSGVAIDFDNFLARQP